ncbi:hypothetical protein GS421_03230 [Rhodococcus hoagii]|nr:hypothetical protein [Prescottella equi]
MFHLPNEWSRVVSATGIGGAITGEKPEWTEKDNSIWSLLVSRCSRRRNPATRCMGRRRSLTPTAAGGSVGASVPRLKVRELEAKRDGTGVKQCRTPRRRR